jgi:hypothetical protein
MSRWRLETALLDEEDMGFRGLEMFGNVGAA